MGKTVINTFFAKANQKGGQSLSDSINGYIEQNEANGYRVVEKKTFITREFEPQIVVVVWMEQPA